MTVSTPRTKTVEKEDKTNNPGDTHFFYMDVTIEKENPDDPGVLDQAHPKVRMDCETSHVVDLIIFFHAPSSLQDNGGQEANVFNIWEIYILWRVSALVSVPYLNGSLP